jgi:SlyX protein
MNAQPSESQSPLSERVVELETLYAHLERTVADLSEVVLAQQRELDALGKKAATLEAELASTTDPEVRKPEDEKPPHY